MAKTRQQRPKVSYRFLRLMIALLYGLLHPLLLMDRSLAQGSINLPSSEQPKDIEPLPAQSPPPLFEEKIPTPAGYSPPVYEEKESKQFKLYRLDIGDGVSVRVKDFPEFDFTGSVDPEGSLDVPILGRVPVVGLTLTELETKIRYELYRRYLQQEPEVTAALTTPRPVQVTILGEVLKPGYYSLAPNTPLTAVLLNSGGSTPNADLRSVIVRRSLVDGTVLEKKVDLYTPLVEGMSLPEIRLQGGDTIIVSRLEVGQDKGYDRQLIARTTLTQSTITVRVLAPVEPSGVALRNVSLPNGSTFLDVVASFPVTDNIRVNTKEIALLRFDADKGGIVTQTLNPEAAVRGDISQNIPLRDQDVIVISRTLLGRLLSSIRILTQPIRDLLGFSNFIYGLGRGFNNNNGYNGLGGFGF